MKRIFLKGAVVVLSVLMLGCSNKIEESKVKEDTKKKEREHIECDYATKELGEESNLPGRYLKTIEEDGKTLYMFYEDNYEVNIEKQPFSIDYYEFDKDKKELVQYKNIITDDRRGMDGNTYIQYNEKSNKLLRYGLIDAKYLYTLYDLDNGNAEDLEIDVKNNDVQWLDEENFCIFDTFEMELYNIKSKEMKHFNFTDYFNETDKSDELTDLYFEHAYLKDNVLIAYLNSFDYRATQVLEIDIDNNQLEKKSRFEGSGVEYTDNYVYYKQYFENATGYFIMDAYNCDYNREINGFDDEDIYGTIKIGIGEDYGCKCGKTGCSILDLRNLELRELKCTKKIHVNEAKMVNGILYVANNDYLYKVDIENDEIEVMAELFISDKNTKDISYSLEGINILSDELGYVNYSDCGEESFSIDHEQKILVYKK